MANTHIKKRSKGMSVRELLGVVFVGLTAFVLVNMIVVEGEAHLVHYFIAGVGAVAGYWIGFGWDRVRGPM